MGQNALQYVADAAGETGDEMILEVTFRKFRNVIFLKIFFLVNIGINTSKNCLQEILIITFLCVNVSIIMS